MYQISKKPVFIICLCVILCGSFFHISFSEANQPVKRTVQSSAQASLGNLKTILCGQLNKESSTKVIPPVLNVVFLLREIKPVYSNYLCKSVSFISFSLLIIHYIQKMDGKKKNVSHTLN